MTLNTTISTSFLKIENCDDQLINSLVSLINTVYNVAENDLWLNNDSRIHAPELTKLITNNQILVAKEDGKLVGLVALTSISDTTAGFGMLSTHKDHQGKGIGSILVTAAENWAKKTNYSKMQLELLIPLNHVNTSKEILAKWYTKLGYKKTRTEPFELMYPEKTNLLACNCDFTIWQKNLI